MKITTFAAFTSFLLLLLHFNLQAQQENKEKIGKALTDYFFLERENIHVQFDKTIFFINEQIWFKGYIFHRKKNVPFFSSINIYAALLDNTGKILDTKLLYGNLGSFSGSFALDKKYPSGKYYLQVYTNWMNNFAEDESFVQELTVINENDNPATALSNGIYSNITIDLHPEGGTLLSGANNTIGVHVYGCGGSPVEIKEAEVTDHKGTIVKKVQLNKMGYGKFDIAAKNTDGYKVSAVIKGVRYEKNFPAAEKTGFTLEVNNYAVADKSIIKVKTKESSASIYNGKPFYVVIHQDEKAAIYEIAFDNNSLEKTLIIDNSELFNGLNTIRLIDVQLNQAGERLIYNYPTASVKADITKGGKNADNTEYSGKLNFPNMSLSVTVLPENTISFDENNDIYTSLLLSPYIKSKEKTPGKYYFNTLSKGKHYELDLYLLAQESKYEWKNILSTPPKQNYEFDMGLIIKGKLNEKVDKSRYKVRMYSLTSALNEYAAIDENNDFYYKNLIIDDSAHVNFTLARVGEKAPKELKIQPQVINAGRKYYKMFKPEIHCTATAGNEEVQTAYEAPKVFKETVELEEVQITKKRLKFSSDFGNSNLTGYKISGEKINGYQTVLTWLRLYSAFDVIDNGMDVSILGRARTSINGGQSGPIVYVDNVQLFDLSMLRSIQMTEVDEVYMNPHAIVASVRNNIGIIKIYLIKGAKNTNKNSTPDIIVRNGFEKIKPFENVNYLSTTDKAFQNFGVINWIPLIMTDENGAFSFNIPETGQKTVKLLIEGFSADGKLISEIKTLNLN